MRRAFAVILTIASAVLYACTGDDTAVTTSDGGTDGGDIVDSSMVTDASDAADAGDSAAPCAPFVLPPSCVVDASDVPDDLRCTAIYDDFDARKLACGVLEYAPAFALWSDGAIKRRFIQIPAGAKIDVTDMDQWSFPPGTKIWKEFQLPFDGGLALVETRLFQKLANGAWRWATYVWSSDNKTAMRNDNGVKGVLGTTYEIPTQMQCNDCHGGRFDKILGFDGVLLSAPEATGLTYAELLRLGLVTSSRGAPPMPSALQIPGTPTERAALGYLHANCGVGCHNEQAQSPANASGLHMRLAAAKLGTATGTDTVVTGANKTPGHQWPGEPTAPDGGWFDIHPGDLSRSLMPARMASRNVDGGRAQMPPIISHQVDDAGLNAIKTWIESMTVDAGYPAPTP